MKLFKLILFFSLLHCFANAQTWHNVGCLHPYSSIFKLYVFNNELIVSMDWYPCNLNTLGIARFDGYNWLSTNGSTTVGIPRSFAKYNDVLIVGGDFQSVSNIPNTSRLAVWDGDTTWSQLSNLTIPNDNPAYSVNALNYKNKLYVGGKFINIGTTSYKYMASWNDTTWSSVGGGLTGGGSPSTGIYCMVEYMGDLIVAGVFTKMGTTVANNIARWDGNSWYALAGGVDGMVSSLCIDTINNILYVGGGFFIADTVSVRCVAGWNGTNWFAPGQGITGGALAMTMFNNDLYVGGQASTNCNDTALARWDGNKWFKVDGPCGTVNALAVYKGNLFVGGYFPNVNGDTTMRFLACYGDSCPLAVNISSFSIQNSTFNIYPNPTTGKFTIETQIPQGTKAEIKIYSIKGEKKQTIKLKQGANTITLDVSDWQKGTYICILEQEGKQQESKKFVVQ